MCAVKLIDPSLFPNTNRWQCFLFGRPLSIASHHFDTRMPSYVDPKVDSTGRMFLPNLHLFQLAYILGGIVDDAVSIRPVPYEVRGKEEAVIDMVCATRLFRNACAAFQLCRTCLKC